VFFDRALVYGERVAAAHGGRVAYRYDPSGVHG
jgi:hypothetical protein